MFDDEVRTILTLCSGLYTIHIGRPLLSSAETPFGGHVRTKGSRTVI